MSHAQSIDLVRNLVAARFAPAGREAAETIREAILIREGLYCGRRFEAAGGYAIWFIEEQRIKIFEHDGRMLEAIDLSSKAAAYLPARMAA